MPSHLVLTTTEKQRYARHLSLPEIGEQGQLLLKEAKILVVGAGGLGAPSLMYLAAAGIGTIGIVDHDAIERSNLQRQLMFTENDIGKNKTDTAYHWLTHFNPHIHVQTHDEKFLEHNADARIASYDLILDATDNIATRRILNRACIRAKKPWIFASVSGFEGMISTFTPYENKNTEPCFACLYPDETRDEDLPSCSVTGMLGAAAGVIGSLQAVEAIRVILSLKPTLSGTLLRFNFRTQEIRRTKLVREKKCGSCVRS